MFLISLCTALVLFTLAAASFTRREVYNSAIGFNGRTRFEINRIYLILFCAILVLTSTLRHGFIDTYAYRIMYKEVRDNLGYIHDNKWGIEAGWLYFLYFLNYFTANPILMLFISALIINVAYTRTMHKYSADVAFSLLIYFCINYLDTNNGLRQFVAAGIVILAFPLLLKKKFIIYALLVILAAQFHASVYVCLIFAFILPGKPFNFRVLIALAVCVVFFIAPNIINNTLEKIFADNDSKYGMYLGNHFGMGIMRALIIGVIPLALAILHLWKCRIMRIEISKEDAMLINALVINSILVFMGLSMQYWARLCFYTSFAPMVLLPKLLYSFTGEKYFRLYKTIAMILYFVFFCYNVYVNIGYGAMDDFYITFQ